MYGVLNFLWSLHDSFNQVQPTHLQIIVYFWFSKSYKMAVWAGQGKHCLQTNPVGHMLILFVNKPSWSYANFSVKWLNLILSFIIIILYWTTDIYSIDNIITFPSFLIKNNAWKKKRNQLPVFSFLMKWTDFGILRLFWTIVNRSLVAFWSNHTHTCASGNKGWENNPKSRKYIAPEIPGFRYIRMLFKSFK